MIRVAQVGDLEQINEIYNQAVLSKFETADLECCELKDRLKWFNEHGAQCPVFVAEVDEVIVGWASLSAYRKGRKALRFTAEISYYVHKVYKGEGYGDRLMTYSIEMARNLGFKTLIAIVLDRNIPSISLLRKHNFNEWGHLPAIADFEGDECGHYYYGLRL